MHGLCMSINILRIAKKKKLHVPCQYLQCDHDREMFATEQQKTYSLCTMRAAVKANCKTSFEPHKLRFKQVRYKAGLCHEVEHIHFQHVLQD